MKIFLWMMAVVMVLGCSKSSQGPESQTVPKTPPAAVQTPPESQAEEPLPTSNLGPMESIKDLDQQVESYHLGQSLSADQLQQNIQLKKRIIRGTFDIEELSRLALDKHWDKIKPNMQKHFVDLMKELLEKKAIFSKEQLKGDNKYYKINYLKEEQEPSDPARSTVYTKMVIPKRSMDLDLTYKLVKKPQGWKIFDVIVDDASLLSNYRFQFDRIIEKGGFEDLIKRMESKLASIH